MVTKINDCYNHFFRKDTYKEGRFQSDYVVFDVETKEEKISTTQKQLTFKLISFIFVENFEVIQKGFEWNLKKFWKKFFNFIKNKENIICINNNMSFDIRASNAFYYLQQQNFELSEKFYMKNRTLILPFIKKENKNKQKILFLDMQNYFAYQSVKDFGKVINLEKINIDFDNCTNEELEKYAIRDCEIVWYFLKEFIFFLINNKLVSTLKSTLSSLAINTYRTKFYKENKIFIHNCIKAIELEQKSYRGGISDVFLKNKEVDCFYTDVNSMYAYIMKNTFLPTRLIANLFSSNHKQSDLVDYMQKCFVLNEYCCICEVSYSLKKGYLLNKKNDITCNIHGENLKGSFCQPELQYIQKNGKILKIHQICVYESEILFDEYVDYFYDIKKNSVGTIREFSKKFLTNLYGKWGQLKEEINQLTKKDFENYFEILLEHESIIKNEEKFKHICSILGVGEIYKINEKLYLQKRKKTKSFDAFIAISSYITSSCRVYLLHLKEISEKNNEKGVYYLDTDSLFQNKIAYLNLKKAGYIGEELGQLKLEKEHANEEIAIKCIFHAPKDYKIKDKIKCKGIKKSNVKLDENSYKIEEFESLHKAIKNNNLNKIIISEKIKILKRSYKKGIVNEETGEITPFILN